MTSGGGGRSVRAVAARRRQGQGGGPSDLGGLGRREDVLREDEGRERRDGPGGGLGLGREVSGPGPCRGSSHSSGMLSCTHAARLHAAQFA